MTNHPGKYYPSTFTNAQIELMMQKLESKNSLHLKNFKVAYTLNYTLQWDILWYKNMMIKWICYILDLLHILTFLLLGLYRKISITVTHKYHIYKYFSLICTNYCQTQKGNCILLLKSLETWTKIGVIRQMSMP